MKILILGGNGMLGHKLFQHFSKENEVKVTLRKGESDYPQFDFYNKENSFFNIDVRNYDLVEKVINEFRPDIIINGVGITHTGRNTKTILSIEVNSLLPHKVALFAKNINSRFIQISTDCVFNGKDGNYKLSDQPNNPELYGRTKHLGEVTDDHCLTLRTSIIGLEIDHKQSLVEWFLSQTGKVGGYSNAIFSGLTTAELARVIEFIMKDFSGLNGVWQISSEPISKYDLLSRLKEKISRNDIEMFENADFKCNRSLNGEEFVKKTGYQVPSWDDMIEELANEVKQRS